MKQSLLFIVFTCFFSAIILSANTGPNVHFEDLNLEEARQKAGVQDQLFFLYFSAKWCLPCQWMEENTFTNGALSEYININYIPVKIDLDAQGSSYIKTKLNVNKLPSVLVFSAAGVLVDRKESTLNADDMLNWLQSLNIPANHLRQQASRQQMPANNAMDAPRPVLGFSRPALVPEEEATPFISPAYTAAPTYHQQTLNETSMAVRPQAVSFTPRSGKQYGVALGPAVYSYTEGIQQVQILEAKFNKTADLLRVANDQFRIVLGQFDSTTEARDFLIFLNRNDFIGEVLPLN